ncbi:MAG: hypothetical protein JXR63_01830 [Spirochaetales bacterium]|nr:hypothetical protein [Spirochaetales bacterium]
MTINDTIIAIATDDHKFLPAKHFGECKFYDIYSLYNGHFSFLKSIENPEYSENDEDLHEEELKPSNIGNLLKENNVSILLCRRMGINVKKMRNNFHIIISRYHKIEDLFNIFSKQMDKEKEKKLKEKKIFILKEA